MSYPTHLPFATRIEIIDSAGRAFSRSYEPGVEIDVQDEGRTIKIFPGGEARREARECECEPLGIAIEPIAFAVYGRSTGRLKYVTEWDEDSAREAAEFYSVVPLHRADQARECPGPTWEYGEMDAMGGVWPVDPDISPEIWASTPVERRRRRIAAGPWVPVEEEETP